MLDRMGARPVVAGLVASATALALAPALLPDSYSWVVPTTNEPAAQGVPGGWLARVGFLLFGGAVLAATSLARDRWDRPATALHAAFGLLLVAAATFSVRPWDPQLPFSATEDLLHSIAATAMGFAFALGVAAVARVRWRRTGSWRPFDLVAVGASVVFPLGMAAVPGGAGALQRAMFVVAYVWYGIEARDAARTDAGGVAAGIPSGAPRR
jgi:hypothetical protein